MSDEEYMERIEAWYSRSWYLALWHALNGVSFYSDEWFRSSCKS